MSEATNVEDVAQSETNEAVPEGDILDDIEEEFEELPELPKAEDAELGELCRVPSEGDDDPEGVENDILDEIESEFEEL